MVFLLLLFFFPVFHFEYIIVDIVEVQLHLYYSKQLAALRSLVTLVEKFFVIGFIISDLIVPRI